MAANYYYGFGHGGGQFSLSSGSYPSGYSAASTSSRAQQQTYSEPHSQLQYGAFTSQMEQGLNAYGDNKTYYMSTSQSTPSASYSSSAADEGRYNLESKYSNTRYLPQTTSHNSDHSPYLASVTSKPAYTTSAYSKPSEWQNVGGPGSQPSHVFPVMDGLATTSQMSTEAGFDSPLFKNSPSYYRDLASGNQQASGGIGTGSRKPFPYGQKPRPRQSPKPSQLHYCEVCRISCAGAQTYMEHLEGKNHKKKEAQAKASEASTSKVSSNPGLRQLYCELCDVACTGADTYAAHIRGAKHQKVLNLHTKLGKPIPEMPAVEAISSGGAKGGSLLSTTQTNEEGITDDKTDRNSAANRDGLDAQEEDSDIQPVGLEYIEESRNEMGSAVSFHCKLCNCNFTDPLAKVMHTKGRRHRLHYKQKVDPTLEVSMKPSPFQKHRQLMRARRHVAGDDYQRRRYYEDSCRREVEELRFQKHCLQLQLNYALEQCDRVPGPFPLVPPVPRALGRQQELELQNDRYVQAKHASIYPNEEDALPGQKFGSRFLVHLHLLANSSILEAVQATVSDCEKALKMVSDLFASLNGEQSQQTVAAPETDEIKEESKDATAVSPPPASAGVGAPRQLKGVMRVGALSKGLLLHDDLNVELVVLCNSWPTHGFLGQVLDEFCKQLEGFAAGKYSVLLSHDRVGILVTSLTAPKITCVITLTSLAVKEGSAQDSEEFLDRSKCLESLAALRHAKWFQAKASSLTSCVILVRILKDICNRVPAWKPLPHWALELLAERCLSSYGDRMSPSAGLRRILECFSAGTFLDNGPGLYDPCEKEHTDALSSLTLQQREEITYNAQHALRLLSFGRIYEVLGINPLPSVELPSHRRKRQRADCQAQQGDSAGGMPHD